MRSLRWACRPLRCSLAAALVLLAPAAWGQISINSSPNVVGSGARALGMGGAFIAVADDATAASWNPGGLTQLERPEVSLVYGWKWLGEEFHSDTHPELGGDYSVNLDEIDYFSIAYPFQHTIAGRNLVLSLNYKRDPIQPQARCCCLPRHHRPSLGQYLRPRDRRRLPPGRQPEHPVARLWVRDHESAFPRVS